MNNLVRLSELKQGEQAVLYKIEGLEKAKHKRLLELGFVSGTPLYCIKSNARQGLIVGIRSFTLCLDKYLCDKIMVFRKVA